MAEIARELGVSEGSVRRIFKLLGKLERQNKPIPTYLGVDEVHIQGVLRFVLVDLEENRIHYILPDNTPATVRDYLFSILDRNRIKVVVMDMSRSYNLQIYEALAEFDFQIVIDRFHITKLLTEDFGSIRVAVGKTLEKREKNYLQKNEFVFTTPAQLQDPSAVAYRDKMLAEQALLRLMYEARYEFFRIFDRIESINVQDAGAKIIAWWQGLSDEVRPYLETTWGTIQEHWERILNNFDPAVTMPDGRHPTNGPVEAMNKMIKKCDRTGGRNLSFENLKTKVLLGYGTKDSYDWEQLAAAHLADDLEQARFALQPKKKKKTRKLRKLVGVSPSAEGSGQEEQEPVQVQQETLASQAAETSLEVKTESPVINIRPTALYAVPRGGSGRRKRWGGKGEHLEQPLLFE